MTWLKFIFLLFTVSFLIASTASQPVILQHGKLCTLQLVGRARDPNGHLWPVYRNICRLIIPGALGDFVADDEEELESNSDEDSKNDSVGELRRAILSKT